MPDPDFYKIKLQNGLTLLFEKRRSPIVSIFLAVRLGSAYEAGANKGICHFIEHAVFKGTKKRNAEEIEHAIEKVGGYINANTEEEETAFYVKIPSKHLELGLDVLADIVLNPLFDEKEIERERDVILEEIKMYNDLPEEYVIDKLKSLLYKEPFGMLSTGTESIVSNIKRQDLCNFHTLYSPENIVLVVVGGVNFTDVLELTRKKFIAEPKTPVKTRIEIESSFGQIIQRRSNLHQSHLALGFHMPSLSDKLRYAADVANTILGVGASSRLYQEIREKRGLAYSVKSIIRQERDYGYITIYAGVKKENIMAVRNIVIKEIRNLQDLQSKELEEAKEKCIGEYLLEDEESEWTAEQLALNELTTEAREFYDYPKRIAAVKLEDVKAAAKPTRYSFVALVPTTIPVPFTPTTPTAAKPAQAEEKKEEEAEKKEERKEEKKVEKEEKEKREEKKEERKEEKKEKAS